MDNITKELTEIGRIIDSAHLLDDVRREVRRALKGHKAMVVGGEFANNPSFDVVVIHQSGKKGDGIIQRRLSSMADIEVELIDAISKNMLGIRSTRRGKHNDVPEA